jgi:hypothetical protein
MESKLSYDTDNPEPPLSPFSVPSPYVIPMVEPSTSLASGCFLAVTNRQR